jgi:hypothetical protein
MGYRLAGRSVEFCSCQAPCPCAFGQQASWGHCEGLIAFAIEQGEVSGVDVAGTKAIMAGRFDGAWTSGNYTAALILDRRDGEEQRRALQQVFSGELGGDAAHLAGLIGSMRGVYLADIDYELDGPELVVNAGEVAEAAGTAMLGPDGATPIQVSGVHYPPTTVTAGTSTRSRVNIEGLAFDHPGYGMYAGPFELKG